VTHLTLVSPIADALSNSRRRHLPLRWHPR